MKRLILFVAAMSLIWMSYGLPGDSMKVKGHIKVAVKETPPFIIKTDSGYSGVSIDMWNSIAKDLDMEFEYQEYILADMLNALENGEVDISINPLTVSSKRLKSFDFLQPFFTTNLTIAIKRNTATFGKKFFSVGLLKTFFLLVVLLIVLGFLLWLSERKHYEGDVKKGLAGVPFFIGFLSGIRRKKADIISKSGGFISIIWGFAIIFILSGYAVTVFFSLNVNRLANEISTVNDLHRLEVGVIKGSAPADYLKSKDIDYIAFDAMSDLVEGLENGKVEAIVHDEPIIKFYLFDNEKESTVQILPVRFNTQYYSFAVPRRSELQYQVNPVLFELIENNVREDILSKYNLEE